MAKGKSPEKMEFTLDKFKTGRYLAVDGLGNRYEYVGTIIKNDIRIVVLNPESGDLYQFDKDGKACVEGSGAKGLANLSHLVRGKRKLYVSVVIDEEGDIVTSEVWDSPTELDLEDDEEYLLNNHVIEV